MHTHVSLHGAAATVLHCLQHDLLNVVFGQIVKLSAASFSVKVVLYLWIFDKCSLEILADFLLWYLHFLIKSHGITNLYSSEMQFVG